MNSTDRTPKTNPPCQICGESANHEFYQAREIMFGLEERFSYFKCSSCGCLQIAQIPENMERFYSDEYHAFFGQDHPEVKRGFIVSLAKNLRDRYAVFNRGAVGRWLFTRRPVMPLRSLSHIKVTPGMRLLDVGCGRGGLLYSLRQMGFKNLLGIDPFLSGDLQYKNGLSVRKCSLGEVEGLWDIVMFHHSFEHMPDQLKTLRRAASLLSESGVCLIRIPLSSSRAWEEYGVDWVQWDAPRHFFLHTVKSFSLLAEKAGLKIDKTVYDSSEFQFWGSEQCRRNISYFSDRSYSVNPERSIFTPSQIETFKQRAAELNAGEKGDQAAFILKRI